VNIASRYLSELLSKASALRSFLLVSTAALAISLSNPLAASTIPTGKCVGVLKTLINFNDLGPGDQETLGALIEIDFDRRIAQVSARQITIDQQGNTRQRREVFRDIPVTIQENQPFTGAFSMSLAGDDVTEDDPPTVLDAVAVNGMQGILIIGGWGESGVCHKR
jgi:hypothetical protein